MLHQNCVALCVMFNTLQRRGHLFLFLFHHEFVNRIRVLQTITVSSQSMWYFTYWSFSQVKNERKRDSTCVGIDFHFVQIYVQPTVHQVRYKKSKDLPFCFVVPRWFFHHFNDLHEFFKHFPNNNDLRSSYFYKNLSLQFKVISPTLLSKIFAAFSGEHLSNVAIPDLWVLLLSW